uniref:NADH-ubiquinone oxidoreductase chain 6 n=1 Tax=Auritibicen japonicus TaxID=1761006 RepID=A0A344ALD4_9HEMI|nr:NADH dehydrogenase subunit 6 [Auritibicen japonicus]
MKIIFLAVILFSFNFMFMKHPLSMGFILLLQTLLSCILCSYNNTSYMFSYILFLIFIGGMLILFMYMSSVASNEKFSFSMKLMLTNLILIMYAYMFINKNNLGFETLNMMIYFYNDHDYHLMNKLFTLPSGILILLMVIYLLFTLIVIVNIVSLKMAPLRSN